MRESCRRAAHTPAARCALSPSLEHAARTSAECFCSRERCRSCACVRDVCESVFNLLRRIKNSAITRQLWLFFKVCCEPRRAEREGARGGCVLCQVAARPDAAPSWMRCQQQILLVWPRGWLVCSANQRFFAARKRELLAALHCTHTRKATAPF